MSITAKLEDLVPGSRAYYSGGRLTWVPPRDPVVVSGKKQKGGGGQKEGQEALFTFEVPIDLVGTRARPWVFEDNKDGIKFRPGAAGWRIAYAHFLNSGEDCITNYADGGTLTDCTFDGDEDSDKCIQANVARGLVITRCRFYRFTTGVQAGLTGHAHPGDVCTVSDCQFDDVRTPLKAVVGTIQHRGNTYRDMATGNKATDGGRLVEIK